MTHISADSWKPNTRLYPHDRLFARTLIPLIPERVHPNHITVARMFLTPLVVVVLLKGWYGIGVVMFLFVALTDALDGSLARVRGQVTKWGTVYDPIADKLLIGSVLFLIVLQHINYALGVALLAVEAVLIAGGWWRRVHGRVESANVWGKSKMFAEVVGITTLLLAVWSGEDLLVDVSTATLSLALVVAIISIFSRMV